VKVIALTGPKGSGKDTAADFICKYYTNVEKAAFADPIKHIVQHIFKLDSHSSREYDRLKRSNMSFEDPSTQTTWRGINGRHVVREIGMLMRSYDEQQFNYYIQKAIIEAAARRSSIFVVTDLRFDNEYIMLRRHGAKIVKIARPDYQYDGHITERGFDDHLIDYVIDNNGSLGAFEVNVMDVIDKIIKE
jgi:hypothetical protein